MAEKLTDYLTDLAIAECLATMRARECVKRHPAAAMDRYFKGVYDQPDKMQKRGRAGRATLPLRDDEELHVRMIARL